MNPKQLKKYFLFKIALITFTGYLVGAFIFTQTQLAIIHRVNKDVLLAGDSRLKARDKAGPTPVANSQKTQSKQQNGASFGAQIPPIMSYSNPLSNEKLYVWPDSNAKHQADSWRSSRPQDAAAMDKIAQSSQAVWLGDWYQNIQADTANWTNTIIQAGALPIFVIYNIPLRDCGSYSAGGAATSSQYLSWIDGIANGLLGKKTVIILEPDALAGLDCLTDSQQNDRYQTLSEAARRLTSRGAYVYLDAGNARWHAAEQISSRLRRIDASNYFGFSLNVSNFLTTDESINYGNQISALTGGKHFLIDTSRNGLGPAPDLNWCNPSGRALGQRPTTATGHALVDAFLWIKAPGESDGSCNGAPESGVWWSEYALGLAQRASY